LSAEGLPHVVNMTSYLFLAGQFKCQLDIDQIN